MDDLNLHALHLEDGAIDMSLSGDRAKIFIDSLVQFFEQNGGENFLTLTVQGNEKKYAITIQNCNGELTPAEKIEQLEREIETLKMAIDEDCSEGFGEEWF